MKAALKTKDFTSSHKCKMQQEQGQEEQDKNKNKNTIFFLKKKNQKSKCI